MTEKRFWLVSLEYDGEHRFVRDNNQIGEKSLSNQEVVDLLNEQHEQIQRLQESLNYNGVYITAKKKKGAWRNDLIDELRKSNQTKDDYIIEIDTDRKKLLKENEQLKQSYAQLKHRHSLLHDVCIEAECDRDRYHKDILSLEKENEQLKKEVESKERLIKAYDQWAYDLKNDGVLDD